VTKESVDDRFKNDDSSLSSQTGISQTADGAADNESTHFDLFDEAPPEFVESQSRFDLIEEIGHGGMGMIYRARDLSLPRFVAVKILRQKYLDNPVAFRKFVNEARITGYLQHPGIAQVYEIGQCTDGRPFSVMRMVEGNDLHQILRHRPTDDTIEDQPGEDETSQVARNESRHDDSRQFDHARLLNIFAQVCQAMAYAHSKDVIHLDLKPGNVMVGAFGEVQILDWGAARFSPETPVEFFDSLGEVDLPEEVMALASTSNVNDDSASTKEASPVHGTFQYMSPEHARGEQVDKRSDVFGLGAMLYEILVGQTPYFGKKRKQIFEQAQNADLVSAIDSLEASTNDRVLIRLAKRCLAPDPDERPADAGEVAAEMASYQETALERAEGDMQRFFELSLDLFCIAGLDGFFRRINSNFSRVLGYSDKELLSKPFLDLVHNEDKDSTVAQMKVLIEGQPVVRFRNRYRAANGTYVEFEWTAQSIPNENVVFAVARNVTEEN